MDFYWEQAHAENTGWAGASEDPRPPPTPSPFTSTPKAATFPPGVALLVLPGPPRAAGLDPGELEARVVVGHQRALFDQGHDDRPQPLGGGGGVTYVAFGHGCCGPGQQVGQLDGRVVRGRAAEHGVHGGAPLAGQEGHAYRTGGVLQHRA